MSANKIANQTDEVVEDLLKEEVDPELFQKVDEQDIDQGERKVIGFSK